MDRITINGGAYQSRSIISGAQRCINLFPEINDDPDAPVRVTHFPTPGLTLKAASPVMAANRCLYAAKNGELFTIIGQSVYFVTPAYALIKLGDLAFNRLTPAFMSDNGLCILIVDGTTTGFAIDLATHLFAKVNDPNFLGGTRVSFLDGFFILNAPGTNSWYLSLPYVTFANLTGGVITPPNIYAAFDPLDIAAKAGASDDVATIFAMRRNVWLIGAQKSSEVWYNSGAADFAYAIVPGIFFEHGTIAPYSPAQQDLSIFFLGADLFGSGVIIRVNADYSSTIISSRGFEYIMSQMPSITDAVGGCYQQNGHSFYIISFPTANRTFACELKTNQWHELAWTDNNGVFNRHRANTFVFAYGLNLVGDWQNGNIYSLDPLNFTDFGGPITRLRTLRHIISGGKRMRGDTFMADLQGGTLTSATPDNPPKVFLRTSVNRGGTFGEAREGEFGAAGEYEAFPFWRNLGMARDFVFELSWSEPIGTALNGGFFRGTETKDD